MSNSAIFDFEASEEYKTVYFFKGNKKEKKLDLTKFRSLIFEKKIGLHSIIFGEIPSEAIE